MSFACVYMYQCTQTYTMHICTVPDNRLSTCYVKP